MRLFKLINSKGIEYDLTSPQAFLKDPAGLGFSVGFEWAKVGSSFFAARQDAEQAYISGNIIFPGYSAYSAFIAFISGENSLTLAYNPDGTWFYIDVKVQSLQKTELGDLWRLRCPVIFAALGLWYKPVTISQTQDDSGNGKTYPYSYNYVYFDTQTGEIIAQNGNIESPCKLVIFGPAVNPAWTLEKDGVTITTGKVTKTIASGDKLVINSDPANMEIAVYDMNNDFVSDAYADSDFSTGRFLYLPKGESRIFVTEEGGNDINALVEVKQLADTV